MCGVTEECRMKLGNYCHRGGEIAVNVSDHVKYTWLRYQVYTLQDICVKLCVVDIILI